MKVLHTVWYYNFFLSERKSLSMLSFSYSYELDIMHPTNRATKNKQVCCCFFLLCPFVLLLPPALDRSKAPSLQGSLFRQLNYTVGVAMIHRYTVASNYKLVRLMLDHYAPFTNIDLEKTRKGKKKIMLFRELTSTDLSNC